MTETVFGFATTQSTVDLVRIDEFGTPGASATADAFHAEVADDASSDGYSQLAARVWFRMRRTGRARDRRVRAVGVTWIEGADQEAAVLVEALVAAGLGPVVRVAPPDASAEFELARGHASDLSGTAGLAVGAALAATQQHLPPDASPSPPLAPPTPPRTRSRARAGAIACGLALLVALALNPALPTVPAQPSRPPQRPFGGAVIVPAPAVPVHEVYDLPQQAPAAPPPPVELIPESPPALIQEVPDTAPEFVPSAPEPQHPAQALPTAEQAPAESPSVEQPPVESTCVLLCGIAL